MWAQNPGKLQLQIIIFCHDNNTNANIKSTWQHYEIVRQHPRREPLLKIPL